jgi:hypothetical protein
VHELNLNKVIIFKKSILKWEKPAFLGKYNTTQGLYKYPYCPA